MLYNYCNNLNIDKNLSTVENLVDRGINREKGKK